MSNIRGYGATEAGNVSHANGAVTGATEDDSLFPKTKGSREDVIEYFGHNVSRRKADLVLLFTYITTGLLDSTATAVWGSFVSMQTGNTVYVGLGLSNPTGSTRWIKSGTSILCFCLGSFIFARFHRRFSVRRRSTLIVSVFTQLLCIVASALIVTLYPNQRDTPDKNGGHDKHWHVLLPLGLVAFQSAGQAVISRALNYSSLTSVVLTSIYCDLFMDAKLFASLTENVERNRRSAAPLLLLVGAILGGVWSQTETGIGGALWTAAAMKLVVLFAWFVWPAEKPGET